MTDLTLATLRRLDGLFQLVGRRVPGEDDAPERYEERLVPVTTGELAAAWGRLGAVAVVGPEVAADVQRIVEATVADPFGDKPQLPALGVAPPAPRPRPTAAHPRAYQGTKARPPKPARPATMDLRPFLCDAGGRDRLFAMLAAEGAAVAAPTLPVAGPPGLLRYFANVIATDAPGVVAAVAAAYRSLDLDRDGDLRLAVAWLFGAAPATAGAWCTLLAGVATARRRETLDVVLRLAALWESPAAVLDDLLAADRRTTDEQFPERMEYAVRRLVLDGDEPGDLPALFELLDGWGGQAALRPHDAPPLERDLRIVERFALEVEGVEPWLAKRLIEGCSRTAGLGGFLDRLLAAGLPADQMCDFALELAHLGEHDHPGSEAAVAAHLDLILATMFRHGARVLDYVREFVNEGAADRLGFAMAMAGRAGQASVGEGGRLHVLAEVFGRLAPAQRERILALDDATLRTLDEHSRRRNDVYLIANGMICMHDIAPREFVGFVTGGAAGALCRTTRVLGMLSCPVRDELLREWLRSPLLQEIGPEARDWVTVLDAHAPGASVPKRLRRHVAGEAELRPAQVERDVQLLREALPAAQLQQLQDLAYGRLKQGLVGTDEDFRELPGAMAHALMLQAGAEEHRRGLRRLIRACYAGDARSIDAHPQNRAWLARHPKIPAATWIEGVRLVRDVEGFGPVELALERDSLEALRLGTYVGSCLGVGGSFAWSAAATVLDINKQVVFARDANGRFLARQIVAITQAGTLACCWVYPAVEALEPVFRDYDAAFARALGVAIDTDETDVDVVLAKNWWDDGRLAPAEPTGS